MAVVAMIFGGMTGFISALIALVLFEASWLLAIGLWSLGGLGIAGLMIALSLAPRQTRLELKGKHA
jgi:hypothetical protein